MRVVVIGGCGFIGTALIGYMEGKGTKIVCIDCNEPTIRYNHVNYIISNEDGMDFYRNLLREDDVIIILKWIGVPSTCVEDGRALIENNIVGTMILAETCAEKK